MSKLLEGNGIGVVTVELNPYHAPRVLPDFAPDVAKGMGCKD
ncbi:MAG: hypothetical protein WCR74_00305 [Betaproteobacteria bacterium]